MKLVKCKFGYEQSFDAAEQQQIRDAMLIETDVEFDEDGKFKDWWTVHMVDLDALPVRAFITIEAVQPLKLTPALANFEQRQRVQMNTRINVAVPGFGLMAIREVQVCYDCCTDTLGHELGKGWQILAICPQPDQRRPDYVLGRPKKEEE